MSPPMFYDAKSEIISAMSALNTDDDRKPYDGKYLTDEIPEVRLVADILHEAFTLDADAEMIPYLNKAIGALKVQVDGEDLNITHSMIAHAIEHLEAAILVIENGPKCS